ncbi:MAG: ABC transporter ATP-binding protein, partial [Bacteroidetes bacterium]|nr:ABC transporter ATP-binding protein [Bacteroidota bacterium]
IATGIAALGYMILSNSFVAFVGWIQTRFTMGIAHRLAVRMIRSYISEPYEFFLTQNSIDLQKRVVHEASVFAQQVLMSSLEVVSKGLVSIVIFLMLFLVDPGLAAIVFGVLGGAYTLIYVMKRNFLQSLGEERLRENRMRFKSLSDLMSGIKEIQLYDARLYFYQPGFIIYNVT